MKKLMGNFVNIKYILIYLCTFEIQKVNLINLCEIKSRLYLNIFYDIHSEQDKQMQRKSKFI